MKPFLLFSLLLANSNSNHDRIRLCCSGSKTIFAADKAINSFWYLYKHQRYSVNGFSEIESIYHTIFKALGIPKSKAVPGWLANPVLLTVGNSCLIFRAQNNNHL